MTFSRNTLDPLDDVNPVGRPPVVTDDYLERLQHLVQTSPKEWGYSFRRWTAQKLKLHLARETGVEISARHVNRLLKKLGLSTRMPPGGSTDRVARASKPHLQQVLASNNRISQPSNQPSKPEILISDITPSTPPDFLWEMELVTQTGLNSSQLVGDATQ